MASVINTNVASLNAQKNLTESQNALATSLQRLSSGLRINSAKDDAAGLAISDRFTTQIRGLNQAGRNANDAISLSQTAEGALGEVTSNLQRIRELAVQSANATNSSSDRAALDLEVQQRLAEIDRISSTTAFNGQKILDGSFGNAAFQIGANVGETISLDLTTSMRQADIGKIASATSVDLDTLITAGTAAETGSAALASFDLTDIQGDYATVAATTGSSTLAVTTAAVDTDSITVSSPGGDVVFTFADTDQSGNAGATTFNVSAVGVVAIEYDFTNNGALDATETADLMRQAIDAYKADGVNADTRLDNITATDDGAGTLTTTYSDAGAPSTLGYNVAVSGTVAGTVNQDASGADEDTTANADLVFTDTDGGTVTVTLNTDLSAATAASIKTLIDAQLGGEFTVADGTTTLDLTDDANLTGSFSASLGGSALTASSTTAGVTDVALVAATTFDVSGDFTIQLGDATAVNVADGSYASAQDLVDAVNTALAGSATATLDDANVMTINSAETITVTGAQGLAALTSGTAGVNTASGSLSTVNVTDVASSNEAMRRIDAALGSVSDLRSTFGAVQNRFESTISNLSTAVENLSAARSRILDADFASETANLTRAQILQQAGTAMLSQANSLPQNVLSLLG
jgi:flagellin